MRPPIFKARCKHQLTHILTLLKEGSGEQHLFYETKIDCNKVMITCGLKGLLESNVFSHYILDHSRTCFSSLCLESVLLWGLLCLLPGGSQHPDLGNQKPKSSFLVNHVQKAGSSHFPLVQHGKHHFLKIFYVSDFIYLKFFFLPLSQFS